MTAATDKPGSGALVISLDTELAWGYHGFGGGDHLSRDGQRERRNVDRLLDLFDQYNAPVTWAIVGHLLLEDCDGRHADLTPPEYDGIDAWYESDPGTSVDVSPLRYAPDIVRSIRDADVAHEIGSHTFSHVLCDRPGCSAAVLRDELRACRSLSERFGVDPDTLVFPRNGVAHLDVVADEGFTVFRGRSADERLRAAPFGRCVEATRFLSRVTPPVVLPREQREGLWNLPASQSLIYDPVSTLTDSLPTHPRVARFKKGIDRARRENKVFHLWAHPHNYDEQMFRELREALRCAAARGVPVMTMRDAVTAFAREGT